MRTGDIDQKLLKQTLRAASLRRRRAILQQIWDERFHEIYISGRFLKLCAAIDRCEEALDMCMPSPLARTFRVIE